MIEQTWEQMPRREIDRKIADLLGYMMYHYDKDYEDRCYYQLWDEDGDPAVFQKSALDWGHRKTEAEAWDDMPHWSEDIADAFVLRQYSDNFTLQKRDGMYGASFAYHMLFDGEGVRWTYDPALSIAVAFIEWAQAGNLNLKKTNYDD